MRTVFLALVIAAAAAVHAEADGGAAPDVKDAAAPCVVEVQNSTELVFDTSAAPDLRKWTEEKFAPAIREWVVKLSDLMASDGWTPPKDITFTFVNTDGSAPAWARAATRKVCLNAKWFRGNLGGQALGATIHELTHIMQAYESEGQNAENCPTWAVEGFADYVRWMLFEPESNGCGFVLKNPVRYHYDGSYRITAHFFAFVESRHPGTLKKLNAALRDHSFDNGKFWKAATGKTVEALDAEWRLANGADKLEPREYKSANGKVFRYRWAEKLPDDDSKVPLLFFMHGAGERGTDNARQLLNGMKDIFAWMDAHEKGYRIVAGQVPSGKRWVEVDWGATSHEIPAEPSETMALQLELLDKLLADPRTDKTRVYATGISMGGFGTWDVLCRRPEVFAAGLPICGGADVAQAPKIAKIPIWTFHGSADNVVRPCRSRDMVSALWAAGSNVHYREYPDARHDVWTRTYRDGEVLEWLFRQRKSEK